MTEQSDILTILNKHYNMHFDTLEFVRDSGSIAYTTFANNHKYFLRVIKPAFYDTAFESIDIQVFLLNHNFSVPPIIFTKDNSPCVDVIEKDEKHIYILYEFIEGDEVNPEQDAEAIGELVGKLHSVMKLYSKPLVKRDKHFYIGRYLDIMIKKQYSKVDEFAAYGDELWEKVKDFPCGYCHGDMYSGNFHKTKDGRMYVLDFDTSCEGFPMYDPTVICDMTDYFKFCDDGYTKSKNVYKRFLSTYLKYIDLSQYEIDAFVDLIALYHFALQATIIETFGIDCVDNEFLDNQLDWLKRWQKQCKLSED